MPVGWFVAELVERQRGGLPPTRKHPFAELDLVRRARWTEIPGGRVLARVEAPAQVLAQLAARQRVTRIPLDSMDGKLSDLTPAQRTAARQVATDAGLDASKLPADPTLRDLLALLAEQNAGVRGRKGLAQLAAERPPRPTTTVRAR